MILCKIEEICERMKVGRVCVCVPVMAAVAAKPWRRWPVCVGLFAVRFVG